MSNEKVERSLSEIGERDARRSVVFWMLGLLLAASIIVNVSLWVRTGDIKAAFHQSQENERVLRCVARVDANYQATVGDGLIAVAANDNAKLVEDAGKLADQIKGLRHLEHLCR